MKFVSKALCVAAVAVGLSGVAQAEDAAPENPWAECGIGAMIFPQNAAAAAISNVIWDLGTTAVTSQLSSPNVCEGEGYAAAVYINDTFVNLEEETAVGQGAYLAGLLDVVACDSASDSAVVDALRTSYGEVLQADSYADKSQTEKAQAYYGALKSAVNAGQCAVI